LVAPKFSHRFWCYQKLGTDIVPETSENLHILTQLSAKKDFELCHRESFCSTETVFQMFRELNPSPSSGCADGLVAPNVFPTFREPLNPSPSSGYAGGLVAPKPSHRFWCYQKLETDIVPETSENLHILTQLSAKEDFIELCYRESFKTDVTQ
jgi:hypothetical protein